MPDPVLERQLSIILNSPNATFEEKRQAELAMIRLDRGEDVQAVRTFFEELFVGTPEEQERRRESSFLTDSAPARAGAFLGSLPGRVRDSLIGTDEERQQFRDSSFLTDSGPARAGARIDTVLANIEGIRNSNPGDPILQGISPERLAQLAPEALATVDPSRQQPAIVGPQNDPNASTVSAPTGLPQTPPDAFLQGTPVNPLDTPALNANAAQVQALAAESAALQAAQLQEAVQLDAFNRAQAQSQLLLTPTANPLAQQVANASLVSPQATPGVNLQALQALVPNVNTPSIQPAINANAQQTRSVAGQQRQLSQAQLQEIERAKRLQLKVRENLIREVILPRFETPRE